MPSRIPEAVLLIVGFVLAALTIWMNGVPREFGDIRTYTFYALALTPGIFCFYGSRACSRRPWSRFLLRAAWTGFLILVGISLWMWRHDGWAGVIWYCVAGAWLITSLLTAVVGFVYGRRVA